MPIPKRQLSPLIRKYVNGSRPAPPRQRPEASASSSRWSPPPAARRDGVPVLGDDQVYVVKYGTVYHPAWCPVVADSWDHAPRRLLVTLLAAVGERTRCPECNRHAKAARASAAQEYHQQARPHPNPTA
ncbi:hypothetical protein AHiyo4_12120 [Arthrobacter sp. Hiyo4]|nr:hypothetical protein AHiyo4_12120 [Arthrobacter sp. Hiyo4]